MNQRSRIESFSDGVFAITVTLLSIDLAVPGPGHGSLLSQLWRHWPAFVAYAISFFTISIIWVNHHTLVMNIAVVNRALLYLNLLLLLFVSAIPFATKTMASYLTRSGGDSEFAAALYSLALEAMAISFTCLFEWTLRGEGRVYEVLPPDKRWEARYRFYGGQAMYVTAIGVSFAMPVAALLMSAVTAVYYMTPAPHVPGSGRLRAWVPRGGTRARSSSVTNSPT